VILGHVVDQFHDDDRLATPAPPKRPILRLEEWLNQIDDLDPGLEHLLVSRLLVKQRRGL